MLRPLEGTSAASKQHTAITSSTSSSTARRKFSIHYEGVSSCLESNNVIGRVCEMGMKMQLHIFMSLSWFKLFFSIMFITLVFSCLFALVLYMSDPKYFSDVEGEAMGEGTMLAPILKSFSLSVQTLLTIGYGVFGPEHPATHMVVFVELWLGLIMTAIVTGLPYLKMSIPYPSLRFSDTLLVTWDNNHEPCLSARYVLQRPNETLSDVKMRIHAVVEATSLQGQTFFEQIPLAVESPEVARVKGSFVLRHPLNSDSPLWKKWRSKMLFPSHEYYAPMIQITVVATDLILQSEVSVTKRYELPDDLQWNRRFVDCMTMLHSERRRQKLRRTSSVSPSKKGAGGTGCAGTGGSRRRSERALQHAMRTMTNEERVPRRTRRVPRQSCCIRQKLKTKDVLLFNLHKVGDTEPLAQAITTTISPASPARAVNVITAGKTFEKAGSRRGSLRDISGAAFLPMPPTNTDVPTPPTKTESCGAGTDSDSAAAEFLPTPPINKDVPTPPTKTESCGAGTDSAPPLRYPVLAFAQQLLGQPFGEASAHMMSCPSTKRRDPSLKGFRRAHTVRALHRARSLIPLCCCCEKKRRVLQRQLTDEGEQRRHPLRSLVSLNSTKSHVINSRNQHHIKATSEDLFHTVYEGTKCTCVRAEDWFWWIMNVWWINILFSTALVLFSLSLTMMVLLMLFDLDCHGLLSRMGVYEGHQDAGYTGLYDKCDANQTLTDFYLDLYWFSLQTVSTVGYGALAPYSWISVVISTVGGFLGFVCVALLTGFIFARYAVPKALVVHSSHAVVTNFNGSRRFMFRVASIFRKNPITRAHVKVFLQHMVLDPATNQIHQRQVPLKLLNNGVNYFMDLPGCFVHEVDSSSPIAHLSQQEIEQRDMVFFVYLKAWDSCLEREVYAQWQYTAANIKLDYHFVNIIWRNQDTGCVTVKLQHLHRTAVDVSMQPVLIARRFLRLLKARVRSKKDRRLEV